MVTVLLNNVTVCLSELHVGNSFVEDSLCNNSVIAVTLRQSLGGNRSLKLCNTLFKSLGNRTPKLSKVTAL